MRFTPANNRAVWPIYRISSAASCQPTIPGATKERCLDSFIAAFGSDVTVIADRCTDGLLSLLESKGLSAIKTNLGNSGSFMRAMQLATESIASDDDIVYFAEDDYLHQPWARPLIGQGMSIAEYVTLYDHPDKYGQDYYYGETSKVVRTAGSHWRYTVSTCMTFASTLGTIRRDMGLWATHCQGPSPRDHDAFVEAGRRGRRLAVCIPGAAYHVSEIGDPEPWVRDAALGVNA